MKKRLSMFLLTSILFFGGVVLSTVAQAKENPANRNQVQSQMRATLCEEGKKERTLAVNAVRTSGDSMLGALKENAPKERSEYFLRNMANYSRLADAAALKVKTNCEPVK
jgi:hypothetical protein